MKPFADHLGIIPDEFITWRDVIANRDNPLLLVEGEIDKAYFEHLRSKFPQKFPVPADVKILQYGGRDSLKNTTILSFARQIVGRVFITFDLDAKEHVQKHLEQVGFEEKKDFVSVGKNRSGKRDIEGLLPDRILSTVYGRETDLVSALGESNDARKSAKNHLKRKLLEEFIYHNDYSDDELKEFEALGKAIAQVLS